MTDQTKPAAPPRAHSSPTPLDLAARTVHRDAATGADTAPEEQSGRAANAPTQNGPADPGAVVNGAAANAGGGLPGANGAANGTGGSPAPASPAPAGPATPATPAAPGAVRIRMTGAQALVRALENVGADVVFGLPGG